MPAEYGSTESPEALGSIQMEHVRELVCDDEPAPVIVVAKLWGIDGRVSENDDAVTRE